MFQACLCRLSIWTDLRKLAFSSRWRCWHLTLAWLDHVFVLWLRWGHWHLIPFDHLLYSRPKSVRDPRAHRWHRRDRRWPDLGLLVLFHHDESQRTNHRYIGGLEFRDWSRPLCRSWTQDRRPAWRRGACGWHHHSKYSWRLYSVRISLISVRPVGHYSMLSRSPFPPCLTWLVWVVGLVHIASSRVMSSLVLSSNRLTVLAVLVLSASDSYAEPPRGLWTMES